MGGRVGGGPGREVELLVDSLGSEGHQSLTHVGSTSQPSALFFSQSLSMSHPMKTGQGSSVKLGQP